MYFVFDLLYLDGYDLTKAPLVERKRALEQLVRRSAGSPLLRFSENLPGEGAPLHREACRLKLEGIISKRADAEYVQARTRDWLKIKCALRQEFVVIGWSAPSGSRTGFGSLVLGAYRDGKLVHTGRVGTGFDDQALHDIAAQLAPLKADRSEASATMTTAERRGVTWVRPQLVAEVSFAEWTDDGRLRHPSFEGMRSDKDPRSVVVEQPTGSSAKGEDTPPSLPDRVPAPKVRRSGRARTDEPVVAAIRSGDARFVRRDEDGRFKESDDVGRSLRTDRAKKAKTPAKSGYGDRGDRTAKRR